MKKFTLFAIAALFSVITFAQKQLALRSAVPFQPKQTLVQSNLKANATVRTSVPAAAARKAPARAANELVTLPANATAEAWAVDQNNSLLALYGESGYVNYTSQVKSLNVAIVNNEVYIQGLAYYFEDAWLKGTLDGSTVTFPATTFVGEDEYGVEIIAGSADEGYTASEFTFTYDADANTLTLDEGYLLFEADEDVSEGILAYGYWGALQLKAGYEGPQVVVLPEDAVLEEYAISYVGSDGTAGSGSVNIAFVGNDVYLNGVSGYLPEAFIKGTLSGNTVTFPADQYLGNYLGIVDINFNPSQFGATDVVFTYDEAAATLTTTDLLFTVYYYNGYYYDNYLANAVIKKVVEVAAVPATPAITAVSNGSYGWTIRFNLPNVDIDGNGLASSKLFYEFFTDVEHDVQPLTFTPATHTRLTEELTVIPFSFTDNYDFEPGLIYLNDLYSADWNKIGIKSIYEGGGETHETEIQWYTIKAYAIDVAREALTAEIAVAEEMLADESKTEGIEEFDAAITAAKNVLGNESATVDEVNAAVAALQDAEAAFVLANKDPLEVEAEWVAKDQGYTNAQKIESFDIDSNISATISKGTGQTDPAYYNSGTALRIYSGNTLTITAADNVEKITSIVFTTGTGQYNGSTLSVEVGELVVDRGTTTWTGADTEVSYTRTGTNGHVRIQKIGIVYKLKGGENPTGISSVSTTSGDARFFDLQGRAANQNAKGVIIMKTAEGNTIKVVRK